MQPTTTEKTNVTAFPVPWAVKLINRLHAMYGTKFLQQWEGLDKAALAVAWAEEMIGYTGDEIARGLAACRTRPFPPTLPEFLALCRPSLNPEVAYHEAVSGMSARARGEMGQWSHPAVYWAAVRITSHDLLSMGWQAIRGRWEAALRSILEQGKWDAVPQPHLQLSAPGQANTTTAESRAALQKIRHMVGTVLDADGRIGDPKAWARRILENPAGRTATVMDMAKRAMEKTS